MNLTNEQVALLASAISGRDQFLETTTERAERLLAWLNKKQMIKEKASQYMSQ